MLEPLNLIVDTLVDENDGDLSPGDISLREAILLANVSANPLTITFASTLKGGAISLSLGELSILNSMIIDGDIDGDSTADITVDANQSFRVFNIDDGNFLSLSQVNIDSLIISGGAANVGGGIVNHENLTVSNSIISGNTANSGGGIYMSFSSFSEYNYTNYYAGTLTLSNSIVTQNAASQEGGGIHTGYGGADVFLINSTISGNNALLGGGIHVQGTYIGGAYGGFFSGDLSVVSSTISGNSASQGGGILNDNFSSTSLVNSTLSGNSDGIYVGYRSSLEVSNSTIVNNDGDGITPSFQSTTLLTNSIIANNIHSDIKLIPGSNYFVLTNGVNLIADGSLVGSNIINEDPQLSALIDNGGPTLTHALLPGSPAIDAGDSGLVSLGDFDQRGDGFPRILDGNGDGFSQIDIGAFEAAEVEVTSLIVDTLVDENDGDLSPGDVSLREAILFANASANPITITFADTLSGGTILLSLGELELSNSMIIDGDIDGNGTADMTVDANQSSRVLSIDDGASTRSDVEINGLVITGGLAEQGGGIYAYENLRISNSVITSNTAENEGGAIFVNGSNTLTLDHTIISNNSAGRTGGGITVVYGSVEVVDSSISGNTAGVDDLFGRGGGIYSEAGSVKLVRSSISNNSSYNGGGISSEYFASLDVVDSLVSGNSATNGGGGIQSSYRGTISLKNSIVSGNTASRAGGGVFGDLYTDIDISNSTISNNSVTDYGASGGGLYLKDSTAQIRDDSQVSNNSVSDLGDGDSFGGGIFGFDSEISISDSAITSNSNNGGVIAYGGGIYVYGDRLTISNSVVSDNSSDGYVSGGGGIFVFGSADVVVSRSTISGNTTLGFESYGGGIANYGSNSHLTIRDSTISNNAVQGSYTYGGGIFSRGVLTVSNSTISNNAALLSADYSYGFNNGGGITNRDGTATVSNSTLSGNSADHKGGGIENNRGILQIRNSTVTNNTASVNQSGGVFTRGYGSNQSQVVVVSSIIAGNNNGDVAKDISSFISQGHNLIGVGNAVDDFSQSTDITMVTDPGLAPLADNGGLTQTHALQPGSLAIDAGSNPDALTTDQRGNGFDRAFNGQADIGAFEAFGIFFSLTNGTDLQGINVENEDIIRFDGTYFSKVFDGSDVGLSSAVIDAFDVVSDNVILMSFSNPITLEGIGLVDDSDIVQFTATQLGEVTSGDFELYLDGSDVGLTQNGEDIDALTQLPDGSLIVSTQGFLNVPGVSGRDEDLIRFTPTSLGNDTSGSWSMYLDGSDVNLAAKQENIDGVSIDSAGRILLSTSGNFNVPEVSGANEDGFIFNPTSLGSSTSGSYEPNLLFEGSPFGLGSNDIGAIDYGTIRTI